MGMLTKVKLNEVSGAAAYDETQKYALADTVLVFLLAGAVYVPTDLELLTVMENHTMYGYYDEAATGNGAIRVITAVRE